MNCSKNWQQLVKAAGKIGKIEKLVIFCIGKVFLMTFYHVYCNCWFLPNLPIFTAFLAGFTNLYCHLPDLPICMAFTNFYCSELGILHNLGKKNLFHSQFTEVKLGKLVKNCKSPMVISHFKFVREDRKKITIDFEAMNQRWCSKEVERCWKALIATKTEQTDHVIHWGDDTWNWQL